RGVAFQPEGCKLSASRSGVRAEGRDYPRGAFIARTQRNPASLHERIAALAPALGVAVVPVQTAFPDSAELGIGSDDVGALHAPKILLAAGDGISGTRYRWVLGFPPRELRRPLSPPPPPPP